ncbi:ABC transporter permease [Roseibium sediminicola]|uniref:ABC transporter permease n=1 Tax=Roseibium sediminicola TaxID=2933272 RepID=A0ABT0H213_9HYPH|nr:ABC transporter permease [Roseibium sp. CAU 1639]MCK7615711.1 ABC transporter permease [Roseibium sp. CAU 1639]
MTLAAMVSTERQPKKLEYLKGYLARNPSLAIGIFMVGFLILFSLLGSFFVDERMAQPLSALPSQPPGLNLLFGSDTQGRNLFAVLVYGTWLTVRLGLIAGAIGILIGGSLGFISAYFGGWTDRIINFSTDVLLTVPALLILVIIASAFKDGMTPTMMALIIAALAWRRPARQIRAQVLVMRNAGYVDTARISGAGPFEIIFFELVPNLMPYLVASFVTAVSAAVLASIGLEAMGLGPQNAPTLGMSIYYMMNFSAFLLKMWWWIIPPIAALIILFVGLYLINTGLDELANPRLRRRA